MEFGEVIELCLKFAPTVQAAVLNHKRHEKEAELDKVRLNKLEKINDLHLGSNEPKGKVSEMPEGWKEGESVPELGHRYWTGYHGVVDSLPENATEAQVQRVVKKIDASMRKFPCPSCRENVVGILEDDPLVKPEIKTKKDAQIALCKTHNHVSEHVGNETVNCEATYG